jgi:hypothetical protein
VGPSSSIVIGYHGCDRALGEQLIAGTAKMSAPSGLKYHWLGSGVYFWENDPARALEWAAEKASRGAISEPFVVGAVIDLRRYLDLSLRENAPIIKLAYDGLAATLAKAGTQLPENRVAPRDTRKRDKVMRFLDHAVLNHLIENSVTPFDTVRGVFVEGEPIYPGAELYEKTHVEIAVRNLSCIKGVFLPL